jgi:acid phosphatase class B
MSRKNKILLLLKIAKSKIVSFDFDETLRFFDGLPNKETIKSLKHHHKLGDTIFVVTSRKETPKNRDFILGFLKEQKILPLIKEVHLVGGLKAPFLKKMNVAHHYDDSMEETDLASSKKFNIKTTLVSNKE